MPKQEKRRMINTVEVISIGPGDPLLLNKKTTEAISGKEKIILRTANHPISAWLKSKNIPFQALDDLYLLSEDFEHLYSSVAETVWKSSEDYGTVVYAVPDALTDRSVDYLISRKPPESELQIIPGFSYYDYYLSLCRGCIGTSNVHVCPASDLKETAVDPSMALLVTEIDNEITAGEIKTYLSEVYDDEDQIWFFSEDGSARKISLYELDRMKKYTHLTAIAAEGRPYLKRRKKTFNDLLLIMDHLRSPEGCSWDRRQTHDSLKPYVIEEAWEATEAIEEKDPAHLSEELGDLLFQVVFHTSIGTAYDEFTVSDVITGICDKMIRRHPHVFGIGQTDNGMDLPDAWDKIKQEEKRLNTFGDSLMHISGKLPSLQYAAKVIRQFEKSPAFCRSADEIISSLHTSANDLHIRKNGDLSEKLGFLLFICAELAVRYGEDGELLLHHTVRRIIDRYKQLESEGKISLESPEGLTFNDLGVY